MTREDLKNLLGYLALALALVAIVLGIYTWTQADESIGFVERVATIGILVQPWLIAAAVLGVGWVIAWLTIGVIEALEDDFDEGAAGTVPGHSWADYWSTPPRAIEVEDSDSIAPLSKPVEARTPPEGLPARDQPHPGEIPSMRLEGGSIVEVLDRNGWWALVRTSSGEVVWVDGRRLL